MKMFNNFRKTPIGFFGGVLSHEPEFFLSNFSTKFEDRRIMDRVETYLQVCLFTTESRLCSITVG